MDQRHTIAAPAPPGERAFVVRHGNAALSPSVFEPRASVAVTPALRAGGLLAKLSDEQARTLLALLTFLTPNGAVHAGAWQLAAALAIRETKARDRLERLCALSHEGQPVAYRLDRESGGPAVYALSRLLIAQEVEEPQEPKQQQRRPSLSPPAGRDAVIARSREKYAVTREEAERMVAEQYAPLNTVPETLDTSPESSAKRALRALGVAVGDIEHLFANYTLEEIERQVMWLPARNARDPKRFIVAAIKGRYAPPVAGRASPPAASVTLTVPQAHEGGADE